MTLLTGEGADACTVQQIAMDAQTCGVPLQVVELPAGAVRSIYAEPYTLVRPDQHVAWRGRTHPDVPVFRTVAGGARLNGDPKRGRTAAAAGDGRET